MLVRIFGFHTIMLAKRLNGGRVLAVEPTRNALARLRRNIALNNTGGNTLVFEGAVSNSVGMNEINTIDGREEYSSLGAMTHPQITGAAIVKECIETRTLRLARRRPRARLRLSQGRCRRF